MRPNVVVGQNVDQSRSLYPVGVVEAHACGGAGAAVVSGDKELAVAELVHDLDLVLRHRPERIIDVVFAGVIWADAVAITAQIGCDDMKTLGQAWGDLVPGDMGQRDAVQQPQRRAVAAVPQMDSCAAGLDFRAGEALEHPLSPVLGLKAELSAGFAREVMYIGSPKGRK